MLDSDGDGYLTTDDLNSLPAEVVDEAFGRTSPGEVRVNPGVQEGWDRGVRLDQ